MSDSLYYHKYRKYKHKYYLLKGGQEDQEIFHVSSIAFKEGQMIPKEYTCDASDTKIPLSWSTPPKSTESFAISIVDPDTKMGSFVHWVAWNIPGDVNEIDEGFKDLEEGYNGADQVGFKGPCPPEGDNPHHYIITVYALDTKLDMGKYAKVGLKELKTEMKNHILARAKLIGVYERK